MQGSGQMVAEVQSTSTFQKTNLASPQAPPTHIRASASMSAELLKPRSRMRLRSEHPIDEEGKAKIDRSTWTADALRTHPEIAELAERLRPLNRASSFSRVYIAEKTGVKDDLRVSRDALLQLVMQHLQSEGLKRSRRILEEEAKVKYVDYQLNESRMLTLLRIAIKDAERVWELMLDTTNKDAAQQLEEHLSDLGLLREDLSDTTEDINIWDEPEEGTIIFVEEKDKAKAEADATSPTATSAIANTAAGAVAGLGSPASPGAVLMGLPSLGERQEEKTKQVKGASLNRLIILLTPADKHDVEFLKTFLLTYQSFTTPEKLLQKLIQRYNVPRREGQADDEWKKMSLPIQLRVINVFKTWIRDHWDGVNDKVIQNLKLFIDNTLRLEGHAKAADALIQQLNSRLRGEGEEEKEKARSFNADPPEPIVPYAKIFSPDLDIFDVEEEEIARQMTLIDFELYGAIKPTELLNQSWSKPKLKHRAQNVLRFAARFNEISTWVAHAILTQAKIRERIRIMSKIIRIAEFLRVLNNFNTAMAMLAGLNNSAVHRLRYTREELPKRYQDGWAELQAALSSNQAYREYRQALARANPPCIPYLGVYLTDLTFIEDGNPENLHGPNGPLVNFGKRKMLYDVISKVKQYQQTPYNLFPVYQIRQLLLRPLKAKVDDDMLYKLSLEREGRNKARSEIL